jgi:hypothetical protein
VSRTASRKEVEQRLIGPEVAYPVDELLLEGLSLDDRLPQGAPYRRVEHM